jgi:nucleotidyltransferase substrate binding protein (TIGR01987 family)
MQTSLPVATRSPECWLLRFENFESVLRRLEGHLEGRAEFRDPDLLAGLVLRHYAFCLELGWKCLRDLLSWNGIDARLPRQVIKQAFATGVIENGQLWIDMLESRPLFTADGDLEGDDGSPEACAVLAAAARMVAESYAPELQALQRNLAARRLEEQGLSEATA